MAKKKPVRRTSRKNSKGTGATRSKMKSSAKDEKRTSSKGRKDRRIYPLGAGDAPADRIVEPTSLNKTGMTRFAMHNVDAPMQLGNLLPANAFATVNATPELNHLDAETAAKMYLQGMLASPEIPGFAGEEVNGEPPEFKSLGTETLPLTGTRTVKFRQSYRKIPVYGSLVTVEVDDANNLVSLNSTLGDPANVDAIAALSPAEVLRKTEQLAGYEKGRLDSTPRLFYFFDQDQSRWRLAYIVENVVKQDSTSAENRPHSVHDLLPSVVDFVFDAHTGELIKERLIGWRRQPRATEQRMGSVKTATSPSIGARALRRL